MEMFGNPEVERWLSAFHNAQIKLPAGTIEDFVYLAKEGRKTSRRKARILYDAHVRKLSSKLSVQIVSVSLRWEKHPGVFEIQLKAASVRGNSVFYDTKCFLINESGAPLRLKPLSITTGLKNVVKQLQDELFSIDPVINNGYMYWYGHKYIYAHKEGDKYISCRYLNNTPYMSYILW